MNRRSLLLGGAAALIGTETINSLLPFPAQAAERFEVTRTDEHWRRTLTPDQYKVLRKHGTERAGSSPLDREKRTGTFACAGCDTVSG